MSYGYFANENREYVITTPRPPVRWINYVGTLEFGGYVDQSGGLLICRGDPAHNRITKYIPGLPGSSMNGAAFYVRTGEEGGYRICSPFYVPCLTEPSQFECHVGPLYSRILGVADGIELEVTFFVPSGEHVLLMDCTLRNANETPVDAAFIPVFEYSHFQALKQFTNADWVPQTMQSRALSLNGTSVLVQYPFMRRDTCWNYAVSSGPLTSFETDRGRFLGDHDFGSWAAPRSLHAPALPGSEANRGDNIAALHHELGSLDPGERRRIVVQLGQTENVSDLDQVVAPFLDHNEVDARFRELQSFWDDYLARFTVETPSQSMNDMLNVHHPKQCFITKNWSRYLSSYQLGLGSRGLGMRDSSQDLLGIMSHMPEEAGKLMRQLFSIQRPDGSAMHLFFPGTGKAHPGEAPDMPDRPQFYGDDHLWIVLTLAAYIKETGDFSILDEQLPYYDPEADEPQHAQGSVTEHVERAIEFTRRNVGRHGLPLLGFADWNDTVNLKAGAESLFNAALYGLVLQEIAELADAIGNDTLATRSRDYWEEMRGRVLEHAWDGDWFIRYLDADGTPLGSARNTTGRIYVNAQSWPILAGYAEGEYAQQALSSVASQLNTRHGIKISRPAYNGYDPNLGGITTYPPGAKENGGIFLHTNPWVIIAETLQGNGDRAFSYYQQINPAEKDPSVYECEPYCYAQNILGDEHPQFGLARNSWLSGTAAWMYRAATWHVLGIRPGYRHLTVDPCIPSSWPGFRVRRSWRGTWYEITVDNPDRVSHGVADCTVDGRSVPHTEIPATPAERTIQVRVTLGPGT